MKLSMYIFINIFFKNQNPIKRRARGRPKKNENTKIRSVSVKKTNTPGKSQEKAQVRTNFFQNLLFAENKKSSKSS